MDLIKRIDDSIELNAPDEHRRYIGGSGVGDECSRKIWYSFQGVKSKPLTAKQRRIFETGHRLEEMVKDYIEEAGFKLVRTSVLYKGEPDPLFCQDDEVKIFQGHCDGLLYLTDNHIVLLEIKTANRDEYKKFVDIGVKGWKPIYYYQLISYMGMKKLKNAFIIVLNKDNGDWSGEWVEYDDIVYSELKLKAVTISNSEEEPKRINDNPCYWLCQMCRYKEVCHSSPQKQTIDQVA